MKKIGILLAILVLLPSGMNAQRLQQKLGRGVVAVNRTGGRSVTSSGGQGNLVSWRKLAEEPEGTSYNLYQRSPGATSFTKVNTTPLTKTNYQPSTMASGTEFAVAAVVNGVEGELSRPFRYTTQPWPNVWFKFDFDNKVLTRNDYRTKFVWPMDLDGNGEFDAVVVDRLFAGAADNDDAENQSDNTSTTSHKIQAYKLDGTLLWTVDMGPNVNISGGQNDMVVAYDINCDGKAEVMIRASDGTRFWDKQNETWGKYAMGSDNPDVDGDGIVDYRSQSVRNRPFYISVIDGATGAEIACNELKYSEVSDGSDSYTRTSRPNYMSDGYSAMDGHFAICYLDGIHPSLVMECLDRDNNKTHHNYVFTWDFDWTGGTPKNWHHSATWSRNDKRPWPAEFHQLRVADVDGDGCDEMIQGGYSVNPLKGWFQSPGIGHGDRFILSDIDPDRPGMEVYAIQQSALLGQLLYDARTGERIKEWYLPSVYDVGRGACMDVDASRKGYELYSFTDDFIYDCKGDKTNYTRSGCGISTMFEGVWWDENLQREELSSPGGSGWGTNLMVTRVLSKNRLVEFSQESNWATHAATGTRPAFMGDIVGDWREEVILVNQNADGSTGLVGYTTNMPTNYSIYCLQQDPHYRGDCTTRGYYQHPNTGFYLGSGMPMPPLPPVFEADLRWKGGSWQNGFTSFDMKQAQTYADNKSVMFDVSGDNASPIVLDGILKPACFYMMNPRGHDYTFQGSGQLAGDMTFIKSMLGTATFNNNFNFTGPTIISEGTLAVNGTIAGPVELRAKGTLSGNAVIAGDITFEEALNYEGCRLKPHETSGVITFNKSLMIPGGVFIEVDAADGKSGRLLVKGDLTLTGQNTISVNHDELTAGSYVVAECTGTLTADPTALKSRGLDGINFEFVVDGQQLLLVVKETRDATTGVVWTGNENSTWDYKSENFDLDGATTFVPGDEVVFDDAALRKNITINDQIVTSGVVFNSGTYTFSGDGGISGEGGVTVNKDANVTFNLKNSDYTGKTIVNGGTLIVPNFYDGGQKSAIGAAAATNGNLQLNGGTLVLSRDNMGTDRIITLTDTATIRIAQANSSLSMKGMINGSGYLIKDGPGQLNFTYGGNNNFAGVIVKRGVIAQGAWNSTFGRSGSPMVLAGGEVHQIDVNSTSTVPNLNHNFTIQEGTNNKILGSSRGKINGTVKGSGNLTIETRYVRCDVGANFSAFEGTLTAIGSQFRLMENVTDMSKTRLILASGAYVAHFKSGSGSEGTATLKIGSLSSGTSATDATLGGSGSSYEIGYLGENTTFYGLLKGANVKKVGDGKLSLRTVGHTSPISVNGGTLELYNTSNSPMSTGAITVNNGGTLSGNGAASNVTVMKGGTLAAGINQTSAANMRITGNLSMRQGSTIRCLLTRSSNMSYSVSGTISHSQDTLLVVVPSTRTLEVGDEITVFNAGFSRSSGNVIVKCQSEGMSYEFDASTINVDGKIRVTAVTDGINVSFADNDLVDVYSYEGIKLRHQVCFGDALQQLPAGVYIVQGKGGTKKVKK